MTYLYVIASKNDGPCKIGFSKNPDKRLKQLQTGHAEKLQIHYAEELADAPAYERLFHKMLNEKRKSGEWFDLTVSDAIAYIGFTLIEYTPSELNIFS